MGKRDLIESLKDRIRAGGGANYYDTDQYAGDTISDEDAADLLTFSDQLDLHDYSDNRHEKILRHTTRAAEKAGGLHDALEDREAAEDIVRWINRSYDNPRTKCDYRIAIRAFGKHVKRLGKQADPPESIDWMSANTPKNYDPKPSRGDMLDFQEDVLPLINDGTENARNRAIFALQFECGLRPHCELFELTVGDVKDGRYGRVIDVDGKTGERSITIILSVPYLNKWLGEYHPYPGQDERYLWVKSNGERMSYVTFSRYFKRAADRIDLDKPVTPKNFRKSNATYLARLGKNESFIEDRQGRERGSDAISHYVAMYGDDRSKEYAEMHGLEVDRESPDEYTPVECPRCHEKTPFDKDICMWCNQALNIDAADSMKEKTRETRAELLRIVQDHPTLLDELDSLEAIFHLVDERPETLEEAEALLEATT